MWPVVLFCGSPFLLAGFILVVYFWLRSRSPEVACLKCRWRGRLSEAARTGQVTTGVDQAVDMAADHVVPGAGFAIEIAKFVGGEKVCPRCGRGPLIPSNELPGPRAPKKRAQ